MSLSPITEAASILAARRRSGKQGPRLPEQYRPCDTDAALAVQAAVTGLLGARIGGWKCATPSAGRPVLAPVYADCIQASSPCTARAHAGQVRVEPELAFILGADLPARDESYTVADIDAAIARTHLALELIDSRYDDPVQATFDENLADGLLNQGLFIGPQIDAEAARAAATLALRVEHGTEPAMTLDGRHPNADPRAPLYWLAEFLRSKGQGLHAGQAVITGSYAGSFALPVGQDVTIEYGGLGALTVRFAAR